MEFSFFAKRSCFSLLLVIHAFAVWLQAQPKEPVFPYRLHQPDFTFKLDKSLKEVSGLSLDATGQMLLAVQDEAGVLYFIDRTTGRLDHYINFAENGDFEGVEWAEGRAYAIKSNGKLYSINFDPEGTVTVQEWETDLKKDYDIEGLGWHPGRKELLIACKSRVKPYTKETRVVFSFDPATGKRLEQPAYAIARLALIDYLNQHPGKMADQLRPGFFEKDLTPKMPFAPSAIAVHPHNSDIYLLSSAGDMLVVLSASGVVKHIEYLKPKIHAQPEGIAFAPDGTLYLSNEGKKGKGLIHVFVQKR